MNILPAAGIIAVEVTEEQKSLSRGKVVAKGKPDVYDMCTSDPLVGDDVLFTLPDDFMLFEIDGKEFAFIYPQDLIAVIEA